MTSSPVLQTSNARVTERVHVPVCKTGYAGSNPAACSMIGLLGDIHGDVGAFAAAATQAALLGAVAIIQLGDAGFGSDFASQLHRYDFPIPAYAMQGNHEDYDWLDKFDATRGRRLELRARTGSVIALPRADLLEIDGRHIACLGGAGSIDKAIRIRQRMHWYEQEIIQDQDVLSLLEKQSHCHKIDLFLSHCPPQSVIQEFFEKGARRIRKSHMFGVPVDWRDPSADQVQSAWESLGTPPNYCGHMHESVTHGACRVLNCYEMIVV